MADTRLTLRNELLTSHLNGATYWTSAMLDDFVENAIGSLYPTWYQRKVATSVGVSGPIQNLPSGARNLYEVVVHEATGRPRFLRGWTEGATTAYVPTSDLTGKTIVWAWTAGFTVPTDDTTPLDITPESRMPVLLKAKMQALESLLTTRVLSDAFLAQQIRRDVNEGEIVEAINSADATLRELAQAAVKLPEVRR